MDRKSRLGKRLVFVPPHFLVELVVSILVWSVQASTSHSNAKSTNSAGLFSSTDGRPFNAMKTSKNSLQTPFLFPMFGQEASLAKTSRLLEWVAEQGLKGSALDSFTNLLASLEKHAPELCCSKTLQVSLARTVDEISAPLSGRWQSSGILSAGVCLTAKTSESPSRVKESTLLGVIETSTVPDKYFLKPNAAAGMLRRANQMGRPLFLHLRRALEKMMEMDQSINPSPTAYTPAPPVIPEPTGAARMSNTRSGGKSAASRRKSVKG